MDGDVLPTGPWQLRTLVAFAALCAVHGGARAQLETPSEGDFAAEQAQQHALDLEELPAPEPQAGDEPVPLADAATAGPTQVPGGIGNADIQEMAAAQFSDSTIIAVIGANDVRFDLSPRALVALKGAGVSEQVIEAMIAAEADKKSSAAPEPTSAQTAETQASVEYAKLTEMIERLAAQQEAAEKALRAPS
jgi:hypothetical protein